MPRLGPDGLPRRELERPVCAIVQRAPTEAERAVGRPPADPGWYLDDYRAESQCPGAGAIRVSAPLPLGATVSLECPAPAGLRGSIDAPCSDDSDFIRGGSPTGTLAVTCDPVTRRCAIRCTEDLDCQVRGLVGARCDLRPLSSLDDRFAGDDSPRGVCRGCPR